MIYLGLYMNASDIRIERRYIGFDKIGCHQVFWVMNGL